MRFPQSGSNPGHTMLSAQSSKLGRQTYSRTARLLYDYFWKLWFKSTLGNMTTPSEPEVLPSYTAKVLTPDGTMFVNVSERNGAPYRVDAMIGKAGTAINSWAQALSSSVTMALQRGISIHDVIETLSNNTSDRSSNSNGRLIQSGPDGLVNGLSIYLTHREAQRIKLRTRRGPSFGGEEY